MISYNEALELILKHSQALLETETVEIMQSHGRILAEKLYAPISLPSYNNSAMDGYALCTEETLLATPENPICFKQTECVAAGELPETPDYAPLNTIEIMTGAPVPDHFDAVVPIENIKKPIVHHSNMVGITAPLKIGANIRYQGEDIQEGNLLLSEGDEITPQKIMTLTGVGIQNISVFKKPNVLVLSTGKELAVNQPLDTNFLIHDCNSPFLQSSLQNKNACNVKVDHILSDTDEEFTTFMQTQLAHKNCPNIIISTGAVSAGKYDFIPRSLKRIGAEIIFHKAAIRPGKPILFAILPNGAFYFGLPGNPSAAASGLRFFVAPLIRQLNKIPREKPIYAYLDQTHTLKKSLCFFLKAHHYIDEKGISRVTILPGQASFMISPMLQANAWVKIDETPSTTPHDTLVAVYPM